MRIIASLFLCVLSANSIAQTFIIKPYVQDATPSSIRILWETSSGDESVVNWGISEELGNTTIGEGSIIQAGSVVVNDIPPLSIAGGHPATVFSKRDEAHYNECKKLNKVL